MAAEDKLDHGSGAGEGAYEHYRKGLVLLASRDFAQAAVPLERAKGLEPHKTSVREALGRAYFNLGFYQKAADEFRFVVDLDPTNDYAHFCLGRALQKLGRLSKARKHIRIACSMRPDRAEYKSYGKILDGK